VIVEIVTPEAVLFSGEADELVARSSAGEYTVMDLHADFVTDALPGVVKVVTAGVTTEYCNHGGFVQVGKDPETGETRVTLLSSVAECTEDVDVERARRALAEAEAQLADPHCDEITRADALAARARAELRLRLTLAQ
jgi:F-type H+-transporting ATPase subunit epsilon